MDGWLSPPRVTYPSDDGACIASQAGRSATRTSHATFRFGSLRPATPDLHLIERCPKPGSQVGSTGATQPVPSRSPPVPSLSVPHFTLARRVGPFWPDWRHELRGQRIHPAHRRLRRVEPSPTSRPQKVT